MSLIIGSGRRNDKVPAQDEEIEAQLGERVSGVGCGIHNRLARPVERSVDQHGPHPWLLKPE
jgi:hypothetical protein